MRIILILISLSCLVPTLREVFIMGCNSVNEGYNIFDPYIDTEFAKKYSPEKFKTITTEFSRGSVLKLLGPPIFDWHDSTTQETLYIYTNDGYLRKKSEKTYYINDFAWYRSNITFDSNGKIINIDKGWSFD